MSRYVVKVITNASKDEINVIDSVNIKMHITKTPEKGKANKQVIKLLSKHFKCSKSNIEIMSGEMSSHKVVEINHLFYGSVAGAKENGMT